MAMVSMTSAASTPLGVVVGEGGGSSDETGGGSSAVVQGVSGLGVFFCFCFFLLESTTFVPLALVFLRFLSSVALGPGAGG